MTTTSRRVQRARDEVGATRLASGEWMYRADETSTWYVISEAALASLCDYLDDEDEQISGDAYSHWCAGTISREATAAEVAVVER